MRQNNTWMSSSLNLIIWAAEKRFWNNCLPVCPSVRLSVCLSVCLSTQSCRNYPPVWLCNSNRAIIVTRVSTNQTIVFLQFLFEDIITRITATCIHSTDLALSSDRFIFESFSKIFDSFYWVDYSVLVAIQSKTFDLNKIKVIFC